MSSTRLGIILIFIAAVIILGTVGVFAFIFYTQELSGNVGDWGSFGSYLSGSIGAPISVLALLGAVIAIHQQSKTDKKVINYTIAADLVRSIERLEDGVDSELSALLINIHYPDCEFTLETNALRILTELNTPEMIERSIPKYSEDKEAMVNAIFGGEPSEIDKYNKVRLYEVCANSCGKLRLMRDLIINHKSLVGHNVVAIYYKRKYKRVVLRLKQAGYPVELWDDIDGMKKS